MTTPTTHPRSTTDRSAPEVSDELPLGDIRPTGWLLSQLRIQADGLAGRLEDVWPDVGPDSGWLGGPGEDWERGPYYLDGLVPLAHLLQDETLLRRAEPWLEWMLASQDASGFFGPSSNDDWWPRMVALKVLIQHADATGDERVVELCRGWFRYQLEHLRERPLFSWGQVRGADNVLSVWWLYRRTGEEWLLELVDLLTEQTFDWDDYLGRDVITGPAQVFAHRTHGPNVAMGLKKGAVDWLRSRDPGHRERTERAFAQLERWHGQAHGWFSGDEWLGGREATAGIETCQVVELMFSLEVLGRLYGGGVYGDRLESVAYNLLPAALDPQMLSHQYHQQANQIAATVARREWTYSSDDANIFGLEPHFGCCTANFHQGWPKLARSLWVRDPDDALRVLAYAPCEVDTDLAGRRVGLSVVTEYPVDPEVRVTVRGEGGAPVRVRLRIPQWCERPALEVDGIPHPIEAVDGYVVVDARSGSVLVLRLPQQVVVQRRERQAAAVSLGPLTLVLGLGENWQQVPGAPGPMECEVRRRTSWNWALDLSEVDRWEVDRSPVAGGLFGSVPALTVRAQGARATRWRGSQDQADPPVLSPVLDHGPRHDLTLVPYGNARLRITEFPVVVERDTRPDAP